MKIKNVLFGKVLALLIVASPCIGDGEPITKDQINTPIECTLALCEKFNNLEQLRQIKRVDWDSVLAADLIRV